MFNKNFWTKMGAVIAALIFWQIISNIINQSILLVGPVTVISKFTELAVKKDFWIITWYSVKHIVGGFFIGAFVGIFLGCLAGRSKTLEIILWPYMACIKSVPVASIIVILLIWMKTGNLSIFISFLIVLPIIYQNVLTGVRSRDKKILEMADIYKITGLKRIWYISLPEMKDYITSSFKTAAGMAWKAGVAAEIIGTPQGSIGQKLYLSKVYLATDELLAWTLMIVIISVLFEKIISLVLDKLIP